MLDLIALFQMMARVLLAVGMPEPATVFAFLGRVGRFALEKAAGAAIERATQAVVERRLSRHQSQPENADN
ncbi:hypothetical protein ACWDFL_37275 [Streptomyces bungoensis]